MKTSKSKITSPEKPSQKSNEYTPPKGSTKKFKTPFPYTSSAEWMILHKDEKPKAELFSVAYLKDKSKAEERPITFCFNGGPGAASAYLHMGALGPIRLEFNDDGSTKAPPTKTQSNKESWLPFTDLVFIDPIGTGFSRVIDKSENQNDEKNESNSENASNDKKHEYSKMNRDLESLCEFIQKFLSKHHRWNSPIYIAGESYGGFRVAKLTRLLQERYGVGLSGAFLISPAIEFDALEGTDYSLFAWTDVFPSLVFSSIHHGKSSLLQSPVKKELSFYFSKRVEIESFTLNKLIPLLSQGQLLSSEIRNQILSEYSDLTGLPKEIVFEAAGRIPFWRYTRLLLKDQQKVLGYYDASITGIDPFPGRESFMGPDPTLGGIDRVFTGGINHHLRFNLGVESEREYHLISEDVFQSWSLDEKRHFYNNSIGAMDDLRYGMSLNPHMKVWISHGIFDLITPYFSSHRLLHKMQFPKEMMNQISTTHYLGGHMFYAWKKSREQFLKDAKSFY